MAKDVLDSAHYPSKGEIVHATHAYSHSRGECVPGIVWQTTNGKIRSLPEPDKMKMAERQTIDVLLPVSEDGNNELFTFDYSPDGFLGTWHSIEECPNE